MTIEIKEAVPQPDMPNVQSIALGNNIVGEARPKRYTGQQLSWHVVLTPANDTGDVFRMVQGHGDTVRAAIGEAIVTQRKRLKRALALLTEIEGQCGTAGMNDDAVREALK